MSYSYLASPYSHQHKHVELERFHAAEMATFTLLQKKIWVYSPIVHCHALAMKFQLPTDYDFWHEYNQAMIRSARRFIILVLDGWENSKGVNDESQLATQFGLQILFMKPMGTEYKISADLHDSTSHAILEETK